MKYEIETVLAGARVERIAQWDEVRDRLEGFLQEETARAEASIAARGKLATALRNLAVKLEEGLPPFEKQLLSDDVSAITDTAKDALRGLPSRYDKRHLQRDIRDSRAHLAGIEQQQESELESFLRAALDAGETHTTTNAMKDVGVTPRELMSMVAAGRQARVGNA